MFVWVKKNNREPIYTEESVFFALKTSVDNHQWTIKELQCQETCLLLHDLPDVPVI